MKTGVWLLVLLLCIVPFAASSAETLSQDEKAAVIAEYTQVFHENAAQWTQFANAMLSDHQVLSSQGHFSLDDRSVIDAMKAVTNVEKDCPFSLSSVFDYVLMHQEGGYVDLCKELGVYHNDGIAHMYVLTMQFDTGEIHPDNMKDVICTDEDTGCSWSIFITDY